MELRDYLLQFKEPMPEWLASYQPGDPFSREGFLGSRVVIYPGSATDGQAIKVFGSSYSAHCIIYVDSYFSKQMMEDELNHPVHRLKGYDRYAQIDLRKNDLVPDGWTPHLPVNYRRRPIPMINRTSHNPYGFVQIFTRNADFGPDHGPERLAVLFLGADANATYDALFCQSDSISPPFAVLLQDHGFGGNYDTFGRNGLLEYLALLAKAFPEFILCENDDRTPWRGFDLIPDVSGDIGGMHQNLRFLFKNNFDKLTPRDYYDFYEIGVTPDSFPRDPSLPDWLWHR